MHMPQVKATVKSVCLLPWACMLGKRCSQRSPNSMHVSLTFMLFDGSMSGCIEECNRQTPFRAACKARGKLSGGIWEPRWF